MFPFRAQRLRHKLGINLANNSCRMIVRQVANQTQNKEILQLERTPRFKRMTVRLHLEQGRYSNKATTPRVCRTFEHEIPYTGD